MAKACTGLQQVSLHHCKQLTDKTLEGLATHRAKEIVQAFHPTLHEGTEQHVGVLIKRRSQYIRHGQDNMPIDDTFMEHLPNLSHPIIHIDLGAS